MGLRLPMALFLILALGSAPGAAAQETSGPEEVLTTPATYRGDQSQPGVLSVRSRPPGARVFVDGEDRGTTPLSLRDLGEGPHEVILYMPDYGAYRYVVEGRTGRIFVDMEAEAGIGIGMVAVFSDPPDARVSVDGKPQGLTPLEIPLQTGPHAIRLTKPGFQPAETTVQVEPDGRHEVSVRLKPENGALLVISTPAGAAVSVDGAEVGTTEDPLRVEPLAPGTHAVRVVKDGYRAWERDDIEISPGRTTTVIAALVPERAFSWVRLYSDPPGARVWLDGRELGRTGPDGLGFKARKGAHSLRLELDPADHPGYLPLETTVHFQNDTEDFRDHPLRLPAVDENYANGLKLAERGKLDEALTFLSRVAPDHPSYGLARVEMVRILAHQGRIREIPAVLGELLQRPEHGRNPVLNLAMGYWSLSAAKDEPEGRSEEALVRAVDALERAVRSPELFPPEQRPSLLLKAYYYLGVACELLFRRTGDVKYVSKGNQAWDVFFGRLEAHGGALGPEWVERARKHRTNLRYLATKLSG